jgi:hypothetical protein
MLLGHHMVGSRCCHANSKVAVRLPAPGKTFSAFVGVDSNSQTQGARGSIIFFVTVAGKEVFRSNVMREGTPTERVSIDLGGATELLLEVGDAGDGITCDQADWAEARIALADGRTLWLGDLPIIAGQVPPVLSADLPFSFIYNGQSSAAAHTSPRRWSLPTRRTRCSSSTVTSRNN